MTNDMKIAGFSTTVLKPVRGFERISDAMKKHDSKTSLPVRADMQSAGSDFYSKEDVVIEPQSSHLFWTDVKAYMQPTEVLIIDVRSSIGLKKSLMLKNTIGVIDSSYYNNPSNEGNIGICLYNFGEQPVTIEKGERIAQGIFLQYLAPDNDQALHNERIGGFGSSNR